MARQFGASRSSRTQTTKLRWLVATLSGVVLILLLSMVYLILRSSDNNLPSNTQGGAYSAAVNNRIDPIITTQSILVAAKRVEANSKITPSMIAIREESTDEMPSGVLLAKDRNTIVGMYANVAINAHLPLVKQYFSEEPQISDLDIPPGYRGCSILVDERSGVEGYIKPNTRVDVLFSYETDSSKKVATILRSVKVLSVAGNSMIEGSSTVKILDKTPVTLLVTEEEARKLELARSLGSLSLSLVGNEEPETPILTPSVVTLDELIGNQKDAAEVEAMAEADGVMYTEDPITKEQIKMVLINGKWRRASF